MSRIASVFKSKKNNLLNIYCTAGYPHLDSTVEVLQSLENAGVDLIEVGIPYSDPLADGTVIQTSSMQALKNGMTVKVLLEQLKKHHSKVPVILMGYLNTILQYGIEPFCKDAAAAGVDGLIIPDLPLYAVEATYLPVFKQYELDFIMLVTPETEVSRIRQIDALSSGFIYAVTSSSTTGSPKCFDEVALYLERLKAMQLRNPVLAGFGVNDSTGFNQVSAHCNGAIIGSAYINALANDTTIAAATNKFIQSIKMKV